jgi:signal transduction histidine kinase
MSAPFVLPEIERAGLTPAASEGLVTFAVLGLVGALGGTLRTRVARHRRRYETLVAVQRTLAAETTLDLALPRLRAALAGRLGVDGLALVARDGARVVVAGGDHVAPDSLVARVLAGGTPHFVGDTGATGRARRAFGVPLTAGGQAVGALAVERAGDIPAEERAALEALGAHIGLALENARLASRQRQFAAELADKVAAARRELEELDRAKSAFVAIASHELRTPLTALQGFSELLVLRRLPPEEVNRLATVMRREAKRLGRIVSDLLDLSRIERGLEPALCRVPLAVEPTIAAAVDLFRHGAATHPIAVACAPSLPPLHADPDAVERVLTNLLSNAVKYSPHGSPVRVSACAHDGVVAIEVADAGRGIAAEALGRIFEPYYRAPDAAAAARGTGIGLAVVKALVEAHGGSVHVDSAPGLGTRVCVVLPVQEGSLP